MIAGLHGLQYCAVDAMLAMDDKVAWVQAQLLRHC